MLEKENKTEESYLTNDLELLFKSDIVPKKTSKPIKPIKPVKTVKKPAKRRKKKKEQKTTPTIDESLINDADAFKLMIKQKKLKLLKELELNEVPVKITPEEEAKLQME